jgi:hypothetical protein
LALEEDKSINFGLEIEIPEIKKELRLLRVYKSAGKYSLADVDAIPVIY